MRDLTKECVKIVGAIAAAMLVGVAGGGPLLAAVTESAVHEDARARSESFTFAFQDAEISQIAQAVLGDTLGVSYSIDPTITGKISFRIDERLTRAQLLEAFEAVLEANGVDLVRQGDSIEIKPRAKAKSSASLHMAGEDTHQIGYEIVATPLSYASPTEVSKALESISPANTVIYANDKLGLLVLGGSRKDLASALETVKVFDQDGLADSKIRWFDLNNAQAQSLATELQHVLEAGGATGVTVIPLKRLNGLFVFGRTTKALDEVGRWIYKLDTPSKEKGATLWVYHPRNVAAEALAQTLSSVLSNQPVAREASAASSSNGRAPLLSMGQSSMGQPGMAPPTLTGQQFAAVTTSANAPVLSSPTSMTFGSDEDAVRIGIDRDSNTLLIFATAARWIQLQRMLQEVDLTPKQILIEASILEVTLSNDLHLGVDWNVLGDRKRGQIGLINSAGGTVAASYPGFAATFISGDIQAAVNALGSVTTVEVVSAPKIMALDNHTAKLSVGDQVPIITQSQQSTVASNASIVNSVNYRSTGVILTVTPRISGDDNIVMDVSQEVSAVSNTSTSNIDSPTIQQRQFESTLVLHNGGVVALGGLISTNKTKVRSGFPILENIPGVGSLFRTDTRNDDRTELIVLLTAKIIRDSTTSDHVMADLLADMREIKGHGLVKLP